MGVTLAYCEQWPYEECPCTGVTIDPTHISMAGYMLWKATGSRFGPCETTVSPCIDPVCCGRCGGYLGHWAPRCACSWRSEIVLPGPVNAIIEVTIDGDEVDPESYHVDSYSWLVNDDDQWPACPHEIVVTYEMGLDPPPGADIVAGELACELAKSFCNDSTCRIPSNLSSMTRQGVTVNFAQDVIGFLPNVNLWVQMVNEPTKVASVWSPDLPAVRHVTWQSGSS